MAHQTRFLRTLRTAMWCGVAFVALTAVLPSAAHAESDTRDNGFRNQRGRAMGHQAQRYRPEQRYEGYQRNPYAYYSAPPVVYPPYGYSERPGAALILNFPLYR